MFKKIILGFALASIIGWFFFITAGLLEKNSDKYSPENIFSKEDKGILLIRDLNELNHAEITQIISENELSSHLKNLQQYIDEKNTEIFISLNRNIVLIKNHKNWKKQDFESIISQISLAGVTSGLHGNYILLTKHVSLTRDSKFYDFTDLDKKASGNLWINQANHISRTDIYALKNGYFEYKSSFHSDIVGTAYEDALNFSSVLPNNISKYSFYERFYALNKDSTLANSNLLDWLDKGFVIAEIEGQKILISDYRTQQTPKLILKEQGLYADMPFQYEGIDVFNGVSFTADFPSRKDSAIYVLELEDKTVFTESFSLAKNILVAYKMGETFALHKDKFTSFFSDLPTKCNFREISAESKRSITIKDKFQFEVSTLPPISSYSYETEKFWVNNDLINVTDFVFIPDHLRGGQSVFIYNTLGEYALIDNTGKLIWSGHADTTLISKPLVIDLYENGKHQVLFSTIKSVHLLDLNGQKVENFPYQCDSPITTKPYVFLWEHQKKCIIGNQKGELILLNGKGDELAIVTVSDYPIIDGLFAYNALGKLKYLCSDKKGVWYTSTLEIPGKIEELNTTANDVFQKVNTQIFGLNTKNDSVFISKLNENKLFIGLGSLIRDNELFYLVNGNIASVYAYNGEFIEEFNLPSPNVSTILKIDDENSSKYLVQDPILNKVFLIDNGKVEKNYFPKECSNKISFSYDKGNNNLLINTILNGAVVQYSFSY